jgi:hypothetical protein
MLIATRQVELVQSTASMSLVHFVDEMLVELGQ